MPLRKAAVQDDAGERLIKIEKVVASIIGSINSVKATAIALRDEVQTNADGHFDNPADLAEVTAVLQQLQADLQEATA